MRRLRDGIISGNFNVEKVHSLTNVITMEKNTQDKFDKLQLFFEPTVSLTITAF